MPLIRYDTGDQVAIDWRFDPCTCGRRLPVLKTIEGRNDDMIITKDGRHIGRLDPIFKKDLNIQEAQIIQETLDNFTIKYVKSESFTENDLQIIHESLCKRVGDVNVIFEEVKQIPRTTAGKFQAVISRVAK